jgi:type IV fimbrial biogenesis protein FimT
MLTIAIAAVLLAVAVPSYTNMVLNNCLTAKTNSFVSAMQLARSSAITFRENVSVGSITCRLDENNDGAGDGTCANADDFGEGIVVFRDLDGDGFADTLVEDINGNGALDVGEDLNANNILDQEIIRRFSFNCAATMDETANSTAFVYSPNGGADPLATINVCDSRDSSTYTGRQMSLSATGRPTTDSSFTCP